MIRCIEDRLREELSLVKESKVKEAMTYSLFSGAKRLRPLLLLTMLKDYNLDYHLGGYEAAALECIHTYSLVHDDLPALDNDDLRRFLPTNHKVYGEDFAILAGDGLLTLAFSLLAKGKAPAKTLPILADRAGCNGMILGQEIDILNDIDSLDLLLQCYGLKTGCLFAAAFEMAVIVAGKDHLVELAQELGTKLGIVFQVQDDLLELTQTTADIGKSVESDANRDKVTIGSFMSIPEINALVDQQFNQISDLLGTLELEGQSLHALLETIAKRRI